MAKLILNMHWEFRIFGYKGSECSSCKGIVKDLSNHYYPSDDDALLEYHNLNGDRRQICRPWILTDLIIEARNQVKESLDFCDGTGARITSYDYATEMLVDNLNWDSIIQRAKPFGYSEDRLADLHEDFIRWLQFYYMMPETLEEMYEDREQEMRDEAELRETERTSPGNGQWG